MISAMKVEAATVAATPTDPASLLVDGEHVAHTAVFSLGKDAALLPSQRPHALALQTWTPAQSAAVINRHLPLWVDGGPGDPHGAAVQGDADPAETGRPGGLQTERTELTDQAVAVPAVVVPAVAVPVAPVPAGQTGTPEQPTASTKARTPLADSGSATSGIAPSKATSLPRDGTDQQTVSRIKRTANRGDLDVPHHPGRLTGLDARLAPSASDAAPAGTSTAGDQIALAGGGIAPRVMETHAAADVRGAALADLDQRPQGLHRPERSPVAGSKAAPAPNRSSDAVVLPQRGAVVVRGIPDALSASTAPEATRLPVTPAPREVVAQQGVAASGTLAAAVRETTATADATHATNLPAGGAPEPGASARDLPATAVAAADTSAVRRRPGDLAGSVSAPSMSDRTAVAQGDRLSSRIAAMVSVGRDHAQQQAQGPSGAESPEIVSPEGMASGRVRQAPDPQNSAAAPGPAMPLRHDVALSRASGLAAEGKDGTVLDAGGGLPAAARTGTTLASEPVATTSLQTASLPRHNLTHMAHLAVQYPDRPVELTLAPEELGSVRMTFGVADGALSMSITAERPETLDLLRRHIDLLAQDFRDLGLGDVNFQFSSGSNGHASQQEPFATSLPDPTPEPAVDEMIASQTLPGQTRPTHADGGLDMRL